MVYVLPLRINNGVIENMNNDYGKLLEDTLKRVNEYLEGLENRRVFPDEGAIEALEKLAVHLPDDPTSPEKVLELLDTVGSPATVASAGGRYFGFVIGGALPATLAANWLAGAWDQNGFGGVSSPVAAKIEEIASEWLLDVLDLPRGSGVGFVTGATMANFTALAAARHRLLARQGWDVEKDGLFGAPEIKVVVGEEVHASMLKALRMVGFGSQRVIRVPVDGEGRMLADKMPALDENTVVSIQAGNINSGAFDPAAEICILANSAGSWVHVDGAFGLWARASKDFSELTAGYGLADSWGMDAHKWLNVPYDSGIVICKDAEAIRGAMSTRAAYLIESGGREPFDYVPEISRRARGIEVWAGLYSLGRAGLADLIERNCEQAEKMAAGLTEAGFEVLNDVVLNQVVVSFGPQEVTEKIVAGIQADGTMWAGGTTWQGRAAMRISFSSWKTTDEDVELSLAAIVRVAGELGDGEK